MSSSGVPTPATPKAKRRITPIALATAPPPTTPPVVAPATAATPATATTTTGVPLETLDRYIQQSLHVLRDEVDGLLANSFVPDDSMLGELEAGVRRVRGCVDRYNSAAVANERAAATERARLAGELKPVKIERTEATKAIYERRAAALSGDTRYLYRCPLADPETGICTGGNASRPCKPTVRKDVASHIARWHMPNDPLRAQRRSDAWWAEGATEARTKRKTNIK